MGAVHRECLSRSIVDHRYLFPLGIGQHNLCLSLRVDNNLASFRGILHLRSTCSQHLLRGNYADVRLLAIAEQTEVAGNGVGGAELLGGHLIGILPVRHPCQNDTTLLGCIVEGDGGIVVLAIIHPFRHLRHRLADELVSVEAADKVLCGAAAEWTARIDVADEHPLLALAILSFELEKVRAFPYPAMVAVFPAERALVLPFLQVLRGVDAHLLTGSQNHVPHPDVLVPEGIRVAEVLLLSSQHRVAIVLRKRLTAITGEGDALCLHVAPERCWPTGRVHGNNSLSVYHARTAEHRSPNIGSQCHAFVLPMDEVGRRSMCPMHVAPHRAIRVILVVEVPYAILIKHTVRVIHPATLRRLVVQRTELLVPERKVGIAILCQLREADAACWYVLYADTQTSPVPIGLQIEHHIVVHLLASHPHILLHLHDAVRDDQHLPFRSRFLDGQPQVAPVGLRRDDALLAGLRHDRLRLADVSCRQGEQSHHRNQFFFHHLTFFLLSMVQRYMFFQRT